MAPEKLTEYERKRLENIKRNDEMMASLRIHSKVAQLSAAANRKRVVSKSYKSSPEKKPKSDNPVVRRSLRTRGMPPDFNGSSDELLESVYKTPKSPSPEKPSPKIMGPLSMIDACSETGTEKKFVKAIMHIAKKSRFDFSVEEEKSQVGVTIKEEKPQLGVSVEEQKPQLGVLTEEEKLQSGVSVKEEFECCRTFKPEKMNDLREEIDEKRSKSFFDSSVKAEKSEFGSCFHLGSLSLEPENIARVVPGRIMVVKFFPTIDVSMIAVGNKFGNIGFWNLESNDEEEDGIYMYRPHTGPISGILIPQSSLSKIFTSCYDGFIRLMDAEKEVFELVHASEQTIYSLSQQPSDVKSLYFGEGQGGLKIWDLRAGKSSANWELHDGRINSIDFNSQNPHIMATSSSNGTACIWDLRNMNSINPKTLRRVDHERAVHSAYFSPSGTSLATTSFDNKIGILSGINFGDTSMIYHHNQTGRWISSFKAIWGWDDSYIFIGNMNRGVDIISPTQRRTVMTLKSAHVSAIPCRFDKHPYKVGTLAGATSGGQVYMWTLK